MAQPARPSWRSNVSLLLTALAALAPGADAEPPASKFTPSLSKAADKFSASVEKGVPVWTIASKSGIGGVSVKLAAGPAPKKLVVRFAGMRTLESLQVEADDLKVKCKAAGSRAEATYHFDASGKVLDGPKNAAASVTIRYLNDGMEVVLTQEKPAKKWRLNWIDAYRR
jgi:hypothetical protein